MSDTGSSRSVSGSYLLGLDTDPETEHHPSYFQVSEERRSALSFVFNSSLPSHAELVPAAVVAQKEAAFYV